MAGKLQAFSLFLAMNLLISLQLQGAVQACHCPTPTPPVVPTPTPTPWAVPSPAPVVPSPTPSGGGGRCPIDALKLNVCANVLNLLKLGIGMPKREECCPLLEGLVDLDAAVCLCTAIKANVLGIGLDVAVDLTLLLNFCGKTDPADFTCPA